MSGFTNVYEDDERASAYAQLEFSGTYYLAFRDLPAIIRGHATGPAALDFGCGTGRSTRFLERLGFEPIGIDISRSMVSLAATADPHGTYLLVPDGDYRLLGERRFDIILSAFAFDNIPDARHRATLLRGLRDLLTPRGRIVILGSTPEIYWHEWLSFTTAAFPTNRTAGSGDQVSIVMKDVPDARPVVDLIWRHEDYVALFTAAGLELLAEHRPLGRADEAYDWISERTIPPWVIYVLGALPREETTRVT